MAEPVRKDGPLSDLQFPESPGSTGNARPGPVQVERRTEISGEQPLLPQNATDQPLGEWPAAREEREWQSGQRTGLLAEDLASARLPDRRMGDAALHGDKRYAASESVGDRVNFIVGRARHIVADRVSHLRRRFEVIRSRAERSDFPERLKERASEYAGEAQRQAAIYRNRAQRYANSNPLQFIAGAAAAGFVVGFLLRMWRDE